VPLSSFHISPKQKKASHPWKRDEKAAVPPLLELAGHAGFKQTLTHPDNGRTPAPPSGLKSPWQDAQTFKGLLGSELRQSVFAKRLPVYGALLPGRSDLLTLLLHGISYSYYMQKEA
jgi:hypothetical protein